MANVVLKDQNGVENTYSDIDTVLLNTEDGGTATYVSEHLIQNQVQADWNQTDSTQPDYIKNKPETFEAEDELPEVTTDDNGKVLGVVDGIWQTMDAPNGSGGGSELPEVTTEDDGKILGVVNGVWSKMEANISGGGEGGSCNCPTGTINVTHTISWDTSVTPTVTFDIAAFGYTAYKISEETPTKDELLSASYSISNYDGSVIYDVTLPESDIMIENEASIMFKFSTNPYFGYVIVYEAGDIPILYAGYDFTLTVPETGMYQIWDTGSALPTTMVGSMTYVAEQEVNFVQADWTQNDSTKPDFIKNRPFGESIGTVFSGVFDIPSTSDFPGTIEDASDIELVVGETYTYRWNGDEFTSECVIAEGLPCIGNVGVVLGGNDNQQPAVIIRDAIGAALGVPAWLAFNVDVMMGTNYGSIAADDKYSCEIIGTIVEKIDSKFIGDIHWDNITNKPFGEVPANTVVCEESVITGSYSSSDSQGISLLTSLISNYMVVDANYTATALMDDSSSMELSGVCVDVSDMYGDGSKAIEFKISNGVTVAMVVYVASQGLNALFTGPTYLPNGTSIDVKVILAEPAIAKIDSAYLPDDIGGGLPEVTTSDNGKVMTVVNGEWAAQTLSITHPTELPAVSTSDAGKFLRVSAAGLWVAETIPNAEEASF